LLERGELMARVFFNQTWFNSVRSGSWNEADYEQVIISNASILFPQWIAVPFKTNVMGDDGTVKQPDLALIDHSYRRWCVVEVELAHHHLVNHVLPQVEAFRTARYDDEHAAYLHRKDASLNLERLKTMMRTEPPEIIVIVDRPDTDWKKHLRPMEVALSIVEPFRGPGNQLLLRINGELPDLPGNVLTRLSRWQMRRLWKVHSPATLPEPSDDDGILEIAVENSPTFWKRTTIGDGVMLSALAGDVLRGWKAVDLVQHDDGSLSIQPIMPE
jgi:hypothetical protein